MGIGMKKRIPGKKADASILSEEEEDSL